MKSYRTVIGTMLALATLAGAPLFAKNTVLLMGDSMMKTIAPWLEMKFIDAGWNVQSCTAIGTGLARLDLYDWMAQSASVVASAKPDVAVVLMGTNDNQPMRTGGTQIVRRGTPEWDKEYASRVDHLMSNLLSGGVKHVVWVELPAMREDRLDADCRGINAVARQVVQQRGQIWFETRLMLGKSPDGAYSADLIQPNGMPLHLRADDGIHLNRKGADWMADRLIAVVQQKVK